MIIRCGVCVFVRLMMCIVRAFMMNSLIRTSTLHFYSLSMDRALCIAS